MSRLVDILFKVIEIELGQRIGDDGDSHYRGVFSGPPEPILKEILKLAKEKGGIEIGESGVLISPVLLLSKDCVDPNGINRSGPCSDSHLVKVRTSDKERFLVLLPAGSPMNDSLGTSIQKMGMVISPDVPASKTDFFQQLLKEAFKDQIISPSLQDIYFDLASDLFARKIVEQDSGDIGDRCQWNLLERLFDYRASGLTRHEELLAALGLFYCAPEDFETYGSFSDVNKIFDKLADLLESEGIQKGFDHIAKDVDEDIKEALAECMQHVRSQCKSGSDFKEAPTLVYCPINHYDESNSIPTWWKKLSLDVWKTLLDKGPAASKKDIKVVCSNTLVPEGKGIPSLVQSDVVFEIGFLDPEDDREVKVVRKVGRTPEEVALLKRDEDQRVTTWVDTDIPEHLTLVYEFSIVTNESEESNPVKIKVISLDSHRIGVVPYSRSALKTKVFQKRSKKKVARKSMGRNSKSSDHSGDKFQAIIELKGMGLHQVDLYTGAHVSLSHEMVGYEVTSEKDVNVTKPITRSKDGHSVSTVETDEDCKYIFTAEVGEEPKSSFELLIEADDDSTIGVESEFDRLVIENQKKVSKERGGTTIQLPSTRAATIQQWILQSECSYRPLIIGPDFADQEVWRKPDWEGDAVVSKLRILQDPRPEHQDLNPPEDFLKIRRKIIKRITDGDGQGFKLVEEVSLSDLMNEVGEIDQKPFASLLEDYIDLYAKWLREDPASATWCDLVLACKADASGGSLNPSPYALMLSPIHPIRLAWQCQAQVVLREALDAHKPCPAASTLNPKINPDSLALPIRENAGSYSLVPFLAVDSDSDYWQVMWNSNSFDELSSDSFTSIFGPWLGLSVDGLASGFSSPQIKRSINEVGRIFSAKSALRILLKSDSEGASSCNNGIEDWVKDHLGKGQDDWFDAGGVRLEVIDGRDESSIPLESSVALMREMSGGMLSWYSDGYGIDTADLAVFAHLGIANPAIEKDEFQDLKTATGTHGLTKWRVRKQTGKNGQFIAETRTSERVQGEMGLANSLNESVYLLENKVSETSDFFVFAPNLTSLSGALDRARYCAVSSSSLDPACFFGQMDEFYLWDYDLPSYSRRAGENNGYYLLASKSSLMQEAIRSVLDDLGGKEAEDLSDELVDELLVEVASRGMPTLKKITSGGNAALGEVGMLVALRVLQGDFISGIPTDSIAPAKVKTSEGGTLNLIIPVDPFLGHFNALRRSMDIKRFERPDLLVASIKFDNESSPYSIQFTPIEVKARSQMMSSSQKRDALRQASEFGDFLKQLWDLGNRHRLWEIAWKNLLCSWIDYGFRVYGQLAEFQKDLEWSSCHQRVLSSILQGEIETSIDSRGRLIVIDKSNQSELCNEDSDRFKETLVINHSDAYKIITSPKDSLIPKLVETLKGWETNSIAPLIEVVQNDGGKAVLPPSPPLDPESGGEEGDMKSPTVVGDPPQKPSGEINTSGDEEANGPPVVKKPEETKENTDIDSGVKFAVGASLGGFSEREFHFHPSNTNLNQLNIGVIGDLGTGKTQLLQALLYNLHRCEDKNRGVSPNVLIFDYKKDYTKSAFVEQTGAKVVKPFDIPLNLFDTSNSTDQRNPWLGRHLFFSDILSKVFSGISAKQKERIKSAVKDSYQRAELNGQGAPTIYDVFEKYGEICGDKIDVPYSIMSNLVDQGIFVDSHDKTLPFDDFCKGVVVVDLADLGQDDDSKNLIVGIFLNLFYENMLRITKKPFIGDSPTLRAIDSFLLVDEADNIMRYEFKVLRQILLQGREFGVGVILASQYPSHFKTRNENYAENLRSWFIHKVPDISVKQLQEMGFTRLHENVASRVKELEVHECLYRTLDIDGEFMKAHPFYKIVNQSE